MWLAGFFNPQSFLTAIMQSMARKNEWPLDRMCLSVEVTKKNREDVTAPPREGSYVYGLFMEGEGRGQGPGARRGPDAVTGRRQAQPGLGGTGTRPCGGGAGCPPPPLQALSEAEQGLGLPRPGGRAPGQGRVCGGSGEGRDPSARALSAPHPYQAGVPGPAAGGQD